MSQPFIGEIKIVGFNFAPQGWAFCNGALLPIAEYDTLFSLIGTTYGGDGQTTFALPDLQGRVPVHAGTAPRSGTTYTLAESAGAENVTLTTQQIPTHTHQLQASTAAGTQPGPGGNAPASSSAVALYSANAPNRSLNPAAVGSVGGDQSHDNVQPFVCVSFIIALFGIYPTHN